MARIVSDRANKTDQVVLLPSSLEDPTKAPPGAYRILLWTACGSISAFFAALVIAYIWRARHDVLLAAGPAAAGVVAVDGADPGEQRHLGNRTPFFPPR